KINNPLELESTFLKILNGLKESSPEEDLFRALNRAMLEKHEKVKWLRKRFDENKLHAFRMVHWAKKKMAEGSIESEFDLPSAVCDCEETLKQVKEEGWILGLK
ncbi:MAG: hypothetical protein VB855_07425, partial [Pirellulaceae bacterium]